MAKETKQLKKMYLLSEAAVERLKQLDEVEKEFTVLDKRMKKILYSKKLKGHTKWIMYNHLLQKYNELRRKMSNEYHKELNAKKSSTENKTMETQTNATSPPTNPFGNIYQPNFDDLEFENEFENQNT